jgi:cell division septum initiation protein DivIVA
MLRRDSSSRTETDTQSIPVNALAPSRVADFDIQSELDRLEQMILESSRIPLTGKTLVDEELLLDQLDLIRINLPEAFKKALAVLERKQDILSEAEEYAQRMIQSAQQRAAQILDETGIIQQAQLEASQIRQQVQQECEALQRKTITESEQLRRSVQQELQQLHQQTLAECQSIQQGADDYADTVLNSIEHQLTNLLKVVHNGRQQLYGGNSTLPVASPNSSGRKVSGKRS